MRLPPTPLLLAALLGLSQCKKSHPDPAKPEDQLPPATQTGAGTFGCLLNGQPWKPSGNNGYPNFLVNYDPTYHGGNLDISVYQYLGNTGNFQAMRFGGDEINKVGTYMLTSPAMPKLYSIYYTDTSKKTPCDSYLLTPSVTATGQLVIMRLDKQKGIVSGTFQFTLIQPGCDTVKITQGRFDYKL